MNRQKVFGKLVALALGLAVMAPSLADAKKGPKKDEPPPEPAALETPVGMNPKTLKWGQAPKAVALVYDSAIEKDFLPQMQEAQPGIQQDHVRAAIEESKAQFRRSLYEFGDMTSRLDGTPLVGEYSYNNGEAVMSITRDGKDRYLFFIQNKLWKIVDVHAYGEKAKYGPDFETAGKKLEKLLKVAGRALPADAAKGRPFQELDWADENTHLRAVNWGNGKLALIFESKETLADLPNLWANKPKVVPAVDPSV
jgi:hypothetical protein